MDYKKSAFEVLENIGGSNNIISVAHCATRLRLVIANEKICNKEALENIDGVKGIFESSGQLQIIFGAGEIDKVYDEFVSEAGIVGSSKEDAGLVADNRQEPFMGAVKNFLMRHLG